MDFHDPRALRWNTVLPRASDAGWYLLLGLEGEMGNVPSANTTFSAVSLFFTWFARSKLSDWWTIELCCLKASQDARLKSHECFLFSPFQINCLLIPHSQPPQWISPEHNSTIAQHQVAQIIDIVCVESFWSCSFSDDRFPLNCVGSGLLHQA